MAPVDMALMESGSDNQSEQQSSTRMSRVVAVLVVLGLVGSAFLLGRGSVTASVSQSVQLVPICGAGIAANLEAALRAAVALSPAAVWNECNSYRGACTTVAEKAVIDANPFCGPAVTQNCAAAGNALGTSTLLKQFKEAIRLQPTLTKHICGTWKAACLQKDDASLLAALPRCNDKSFCHGGDKPVCEPAAIPPARGIPTPDLGEQFSCATAGKPETAMAGICTLFKQNCQQADDMIWLQNRPRCMGKIPRHDGTLDDIN